MIGAFQLFTEPFVMTRGGPANSSLSVVQYIYLAAFRDIRMDKASAMAWCPVCVYLRFHAFPELAAEAVGLL
jgi:ABC-type sugar transport system permease subunit